jgi:hypothetical protein
MEWLRHAARMREMRNYSRNLMGRPLGRPRHSLNESTILKRVLNRVSGCVLDSSGSRQGPVAWVYEHGNETSCSIKVGKFEKLNDYQLIKRDSAPWSLLPSTYYTSGYRGIVMRGHTSKLQSHFISPVQHSTIHFSKM